MARPKQHKRNLRKKAFKNAPANGQRHPLSEINPSFLNTHESAGPLPPPAEVNTIKEEETSCFGDMQLKETVTVPPDVIADKHGPPSTPDMKHSPILDIESNLTNKEVVTAHTIGEETPKNELTASPSASIKRSTGRKGEVMECRRMTKSQIEKPRGVEDHVPKVQYTSPDIKAKESSGSQGSALNDKLVYLDPDERRFRSFIDGENPGPAFPSQEEINIGVYSIYADASTCDDAEPGWKFVVDKRRHPGIGPWKFDKVLGKGSSGIVVHSKHEVTGESAAIKVVPKAPRPGEVINGDLDPCKKSPTGNFIREVACLKMLNEHPNVVSVKDLWQDSEHIYMIMDFVEGGELLSHMNKNKQGLPEWEAIKYFRQILSVLEYAHHIEIFHRDLKLENMLLDSNGNIFIIDFGLGGRCCGKTLSLTCGSPHYTAPEVVRGVSYDARIADIWSVGVILFALLDGHMPFNGRYDNDIDGMFANIVAGRFTMPQGMSEAMKDLLYKIFEINPDNRISLKDIWQHPAVAKYAPRDNDGHEIDRFDISKLINMRELRGRFVRSLKEANKETISLLKVLWNKELIDIEYLLAHRQPNKIKVHFNLLEKYRKWQILNHPDKCIAQMAGQRKPVLRNLDEQKERCGGAKQRGGLVPSITWPSTRYVQPSFQHWTDHPFHIHRALTSVELRQTHDTAPWNRELNHSTSITMAPKARESEQIPEQGAEGESIRPALGNAPENTAPGIFHGEIIIMPHIGRNNLPRESPRFNLEALPNYIPGLGIFPDYPNHPFSLNDLMFPPSDPVAPHGSGSLIPDVARSGNGSEINDHHGANDFQDQPVGHEATVSDGEIEQVPQPVSDGAIVVPDVVIGGEESPAPADESEYVDPDTNLLQAESGQQAKKRRKSFVRVVSETILSSLKAPAKKTSTASSASDSEDVEATSYQNSKHLGKRARALRTLKKSTCYGTDDGTDPPVPATPLFPYGEPLDEVGTDKRPGTQGWLNRTVHGKTRRFVCLSLCAEETRRAILNEWSKWGPEGCVLLQDDRVGLHMRVYMPSDNQLFGRGGTFSAEIRVASGDKYNGTCVVRFVKESGPWKGFDQMTTELIRVAVANGIKIDDTTAIRRMMEVFD